MHFLLFYPDFVGFHCTDQQSVDGFFFKYDLILFTKTEQKFELQPINNGFGGVISTQPGFVSGGGIASSQETTDSSYNHAYPNLGFGGGMNTTPSFGGGIGSEMVTTTPAFGSGIQTSLVSGNSGGGIGTNQIVTDSSNGFGQYSSDMSSTTHTTSSF